MSAVDNNVKRTERAGGDDDAQMADPEERLDGRAVATVRTGVVDADAAAETVDEEARDEPLAAPALELVDGRVDLVLRGDVAARGEAEFGTGQLRIEARLPRRVDAVLADLGALLLILVARALWLLAAEG